MDVGSHQPNTMVGRVLGTLFSGAGDFNPWRASLTLAELESATGALAAVLLGFLDARVAGQEAIAA
jgi:hypothetical protein